MCRYEGYPARSLLAVIGHNFHAFRSVIEGRYHKLYSKRSGNWRAEKVKQQKTYNYVPVTMADVLKRRAHDAKTIGRKIEICLSNPVNLAPTIEMRESPATAVLVDENISRIKNKDLTD